MTKIVDFNPNEIQSLNITGFGIYIRCKEHAISNTLKSCTVN